MKKTIITKKQDTGNYLATKITLKIDRESLPEDYFAVYVCNNGNDTTPTWEDCTVQVVNNAHYYFTNTTLASPTGAILVKIEFDFSDSIYFDPSSTNLNYDSSFMSLNPGEVVLKGFNQEESFSKEATLGLWYECSIHYPQNSKLTSLDMTASTFYENFTDPSKIFFPISPWSIVNYNGSNKLRSQQITNNGTTSLSFTVNTTHLEVDYLVSSENSCDFLWIIVDGQTQVKVAGTDYTSAQTLSLNLNAGNHTVEFRYTKDGSVSGGNDRGEIWAIRYLKQVDVSTNKFLIVDGTDVKCIPSGTSDLSGLSSLTTLGTYPMADASLFASNGMDITSLKYILLNKRSLILSDSPKIILSGNQASFQEEFISLGAMAMTNTDIEFNDSSITGIEKCTINGNCDSDATLRFMFSKDSGVTGVAWDGSNWVTIGSLSDFASKGMTLDVVNNLTSAQLLLVSDSKKIRVAMLMGGSSSSSNVSVTGITFEYN